MEQRSPAPEQALQHSGKKLDAKHYDYEKLFTACVDQDRRALTIVGRDAQGRFILETYEEYSIGSAAGSVSEFYILTDAEYLRYAKKALINCCITQAEYARLCSLCQEADGGKTIGSRCPDDPFYALIAEYPDCAVDYCIVTGDPQGYRGLSSHREALRLACGRIFSDGRDGEAWHRDLRAAKAKRVDAEELFTSRYREGRLNYRKAFLYPPHENSYTGADFVKINAALFPNGTGGLEAYEWSTDWSDYFGEGHEWRGALCLTVYDKRLDRFAVILASATD